MTTHRIDGNKVVVEDDRRKKPTNCWTKRRDRRTRPHNAPTVTIKGLREENEKLEEKIARLEKQLIEANYKIRNW